MLLIKIRSYAWCQVSNLVPMKRSTVWYINPTSTISSLLDFEAHLFGFTDGSFDRHNGSNCKA